MNTKVDGQITCVFAEHLTGVGKETRKPYNFINVSNGIEKVAFGTDLTQEDTKHLSPGDDVTVRVSVNPWNPRQNQITEIL